MGKGVGKGSGGGGASGALQRAVGVVNKTGVSKGEYLREGMRDMRTHAGAYAGASPAKATTIATGKAPAANTGGVMPPIKVTVEGRTVHLVDGRHRAAAARAAGATKIRAEVSTYHNGRKVTVTRNVRL